MWLNAHTFNNHIIACNRYASFSLGFPLSTEVFPRSVKGHHRSKLWPLFPFYTGPGILKALDLLWHPNGIVHILSTLPDCLGELLGGNPLGCSAQSHHSGSALASDCRQHGGPLELAPSVRPTISILGVTIIQTAVTVINHYDNLVMWIVNCG